MTGEEYMQFFIDGNLKRSSCVLMFEEGIRNLKRIEQDCLKSGDIETADKAREQAEIAKWEAISFAEWEKENGVIEI